MGLPIRSCKTLSKLVNSAIMVVSESKKLTNDFCKEGSNSTPRSVKGSFKGAFDLCVSPMWFIFRLFKEVYGRSFR